MRKYTELSKTEYDNVLQEKYGSDVTLVDMGDGTYQVLKFVGYEDGDPEYECDDTYPCAHDIGTNEDCVSGIAVKGINGVIFS